jgi:hypothetical protein
MPQNNQLIRGNDCLRLELNAGNWRILLGAGLLFALFFLGVGVLGA